MQITDIRQRLHQFIDTMKDKKAEAIYILLENEIEADVTAYTDEFKTTLDKRFEHYRNDGKMISAEEANKEINSLLQSTVSNKI